MSDETKFDQASHALNNLGNVLARYENENEKLKRLLKAAILTIYDSHGELDNCEHCKLDVPCNGSIYIGGGGGCRFEKEARSLGIEVDS